MLLNRQNHAVKLQFHMKTKRLSPEDISRRKRIGQNIKRLRLSHGIKRQQDLADKLGLTRNYIGRLEAGHASFGSDAEKKFSKLFSVDMSEFYKDSFAPGELDQELMLLREEVSKYGGVDKVRKLRQMLPVLFDERKPENNPFPDKEKRRRRPT